MKLKEIAEVLSGKLIKKEEYKLEGVPVITAGMIVDNKIKAPSKFIDEKLYNSLSKYSVKTNDIIVPIIISSNFDIGIVNDNILPSIISNQVCIIRPEENIALQLIEYLNEKENKKNFTQCVIKLAKGSALQRITIKELEEIELNIPF